MQVSALNLIIAAQQARTVGTAQRPANAPPTAAEPKTSEAPAPAALKFADAAPTRTAANPFAVPVALGSQLDIRV